MAQCTEYCGDLGNPAFTQQFQPVTGNDRAEKADDRFVALDSPFDHCRQGRLVIPKMHYEPTPADEAAHIGEMARYFRSQLASGEHRGMLVLFNSQRAMDLFLTHVTDLRLQLLVQGISPVTGWWKPIVSGSGRAEQCAYRPAFFCRRS